MRRGGGGEGRADYEIIQSTTKIRRGIYLSFPSAVLQTAAFALRYRPVLRLGGGGSGCRVDADASERGASERVEGGGGEDDSIHVYDTSNVI